MRAINFTKLKQTYLKPRSNDSHKGNFGHVMVVGGDFGMAGAVRMSAEAALRVGAGLVSIVTHREHANTINATRPEIMTPLFQRPNQLSQLAERATVLAIGPGLGRQHWGQHLFQQALEIDLPKIVDADALWFLAQQPHCREDWILTPHPKEAARLLDCDLQTVQADRPKAIDALQKKYGGTIILKGFGSLVKSKGKATRICKAGNPGMATAGMGDVLTGIIAGLAAQAIPLLEAAALGAAVHAMAGDLHSEQFGQRGTLATDIFPQLQQLVN